MAKATAPIPASKPADITKYIPYLLGLLAGIVYSGTLTHGFVLDDVAVIGNNKLVHDGIAGIPKLLTTFYWQGYWNLNAGLYRPLSMIMFAIEWQLSANNPMIHHAVQVLLYAVLITQLYKLLYRLLATTALWLPLSVTLLFAMHPIHAEVVANIKSRDEILCFLFFVIAANELVARQKVTWVVMLCYLLSLLSKEAGLLYLPVFYLLAVQFMGRTMKQATTMLLPLAIIAGLWLALHTYVIQVASPPRVPYTYADNSLLACTSYASRLATGLAILGMYMLKSVWPYRMSYDYSFNDIPCEDGFSIKAIMVVLACVGLLYVAWKQFRKQPVLSFGILYFFCTIIFAANVFFLIGTTMGDRLLFAPVLGTMLCLAWGIYKLTNQLAAVKPANTATIAAAALALIFSYQAFARSRDWSTNTTLFTADAAKGSGSSRIQYNYATVLLNALPEEKNERAAVLGELIPLLESAVTTDTAYADAWANLGVGYYKGGQYEKSITATRRAMQLKPTDTSLRMNIGDALYKLQRYDAAAAEFEYCLAHNIKETHAYNVLGTIYFATQHYDKAITVFKEGVTRDTTDAELWMNYGNALGVSKMYPEAIKAFSTSLRITPGQKNVLYAMALTYQNMGDTVKAKEYYSIMQSK